MPDRRFRPVQESDWPAISSLEADTYGTKGLAEGLETLRSRARPATSFVLDGADPIGGYLLALPYPRGAFPDLTRPETRPHHSPNLHLHDIVVAPGLRDRGWGGRMVRHLTTIARSQAYDRISLVAVEGTAGFWTARGFRPHPRVEVPGAYGPGAVYMCHDIG